MTRAVRVWATISPFERDLIEGALTRSEPGSMLVAALHADLDDHHRLADALTAPSYDGFLIPEHDVGPRLDPEHCQGCDTEVRRELWPLYDPEKRDTVWLGEGCWRKRWGLRRRGDDTAGDQLEAFRIPPKETA